LLAVKCGGMASGALACLSDEGEEEQPLRNAVRTKAVRKSQPNRIENIIPTLPSDYS